MPESSSSPVKRACDSCHRRKVKCIGGDGPRPCRNCMMANLECTFNAVPQKKGPKGSKAKVLATLPQAQKHSQHRSPSVSLPEHRHLTSPLALARTPGIVTRETINDCVDSFFMYMYPTQPILHRGQVQDMISAMEENTEAYCLITALCAYMMIQPRTASQQNAAVEGSTDSPWSTYWGHRLLEESLRVRKGYNYVDNPTTFSITTSFFYFACYFGLDKHNIAWYHLREATTLALVIGMNNEQLYETGDAIDASRARRLFWLLFVTERAVALQRHRPITLQATIEIPKVDEDPSETTELTGFVHLVNLFKPFDNNFIGLWNRTQTGCTVSWLSKLQDQLSDALPAYLDGTETQAADLQVSQQWLRTMIWQLTMSYGFLSSAAAADSSLSFTFPIAVSRDTIAVSTQFSQAAMEVHGIGFIEKLFDIACTLTDVMACVPIEQAALDAGPREYLRNFLSLLSTLRGGQSRYLPLLLSKINEALPSMHSTVVPFLSAAAGKRPVDDYAGSQPSSAGSKTDTTFAGSPMATSPMIAPGAAFDHRDFGRPASYGIPYPMMATGVSQVDITAQEVMASMYRSARGEPMFPE